MIGGVELSPLPWWAGSNSHLCHDGRSRTLTSAVVLIGFEPIVADAPERSMRVLAPCVRRTGLRVQLALVQICKHNTPRVFISKCSRYYMQYYMHCTCPLRYLMVSFFTDTEHLDYTSFDEWHDAIDGTDLRKPWDRGSSGTLLDTGTCRSPVDWRTSSWHQCIRARNFGTHRYLQKQTRIAAQVLHGFWIRFEHSIRSQRIGDQP